MGLLNGYKSDENKTGSFYGKYSFGNLYDEILTEEHIKKGLNHVVDDLKHAGCYNSFPGSEAMDVGTGRQAIALSMLGAKSVSHYDLSSEHVSRFKNLLSNEYKHYNITSSQIDLCRDSPTKESFDFVLLNGIVQHFSNPAVGLKNCANAVKKDGKIWVYFYRHGSFKWFVCSMIRKLLHYKMVDFGFLSSALIYGDGDYSVGVVSAIMDDFFTPYVYLYTPSEYINFMQMIGFEISGSKYLDPMTNDINHDCLHHSAIIVFQRKSMLKIDQIETGNLLTPEADINQLDPSLYQDKRAQTSLELFFKFQDEIEKNPEPITLWSTALALHKIGAAHYYGHPELPPRYQELDRILKNSTDVLKKL